ncbi:hypothetical protein AB205_0043850 [Aquarana catesbeiana]|uniref:Uncharacterized protein n=1 Tax=Aquarana catesbeiana TaxID=8400 RepID=A0A2G9SB56_AQUCT|nr:hypothetical protein AB205_0043850 [Aquarana catesbeiana]
MTKVAKSLRQNFGVRRSKEQISKRWSYLKLREPDQYRRIKRVLLKREKRLAGHHSEDSRDPPHHQEGEISPRPPEDLEEGEVEEVDEIVTQTGEKRLAGHHSEATRDSPYHQEGEISPRPPEDLEEGEVEEVDEIVTQIVPSYMLYVTAFWTVGLWFDFGLTVCRQERLSGRSSVGETFGVYSDGKTGRVYTALDLSQAEDCPDKFYLSQ